MAITLAGLVTGARNLFNDRLDDNYIIDDISDQVDGTNKRFRVTNRNIVNSGDGAPADPVFTINGTVYASVTVSKSTGIAVFTAAPAEGAYVLAEYYHVLIVDANYEAWASDAANFVGQTSVTAIPDGLASACHNYIAAMAAEKMSDLSSWYYSANAGNSSFNKDAIATKFREMMKAKMEIAEKLREDYYTRHGQRNAPSTQVANYSGVKTVTPRR